jgi:GR25 family glycosyltransferase involved in LPS biosynthesis
MSSPLSPSSFPPLRPLPPSSPQSWDIAFLGTFYEDVDIYNDFIAHQHPVNIRQFADVDRAYGGGSHAYLVRKRAARALIEVATTRGIQQAIDWYGFNDGFKRWILYRLLL